MRIYTNNSGLRHFLDSKSDRKIAFIPTMGALHEGHISLVELGKSVAETTVTSIFVNPTQFNQNSDFDKYPRTFTSDAYKLMDAQCSALYFPTVDQVYPSGLDTDVDIDLEGLDDVMEGKFRPGHFAGMLQVVKRLLDIVQPDFLVMGQKDFQQFSLVAHMIKKLDLPVKLIVGPTLREADGLAKSSRNVRLSPEMRQKSIILSKMLNMATENAPKMDFSGICQFALENIEKEGLKAEYFEIVDGHSLKTLSNWSESNYIVACLAAWAGDVRLIDNMILKQGNF